MSAGLTPASAKAAGPDQTAPVYVRSILPAHLVLGRLARAEHLDPRPRQAPRHLGLHDDDGAAAVADDAAVEPVQRIGDHRRVDDVLDGDDLAQHGVRIVLGVVRGGHLDPGELLARGPVLVHVAHGAHRVLVHHGAARRDTRRARPGVVAP